MNNELMHYGVIGMRWGIRKADKNGASYTYKSYGQRKYEKQVDKMMSNGSSEDKIRRASNRLDTFKKRDAKRQKYAESTTIGRHIISGIIHGPIGSGNYNRLRSAGYTKIDATLKSGGWMPIASLATVPYTRREELKKSF